MTLVKILCYTDMITWTACRLPYAIKNLTEEENMEVFEEGKDISEYKEPENILKCLIRDRAKIQQYIDNDPENLKLKKNFEEVLKEIDKGIKKFSAIVLKHKN